MGCGSSGQRLRILSIHWGITIGGVGKYAASIDDVSKYAPIDIQTICILCPSWHCDRSTLARLSAKEIVIKSRFDLSWVWQISQEIERIKPNLIMTHGFNGHFIAMAMDMIGRHPVKKICSYHGEYHAPRKNRKLLEKPFDLMTEFFIRRRVVSVVSVAEYCKEYLVQRRVTPDKIEVIHNGIDGSFVPPKKARWQLRDEWGIKDDEILLGVASRLDPVKGISYLIDAFAREGKRMDNLKLVIAGTGMLDNTLKRRVDEIGLSRRIVFAGFRSDVNDCLSAFDIFVLPSLAEYHSIALLEAMRAKKAIIATNVGGNPESVRHEREAILIPPANTDSLAKAIERLSTNPTMRTKLAKAAYKRFQQEFTTEQMVHRTADWILRCGSPLTPIRN